MRYIYLYMYRARKNITGKQNRTPITTYPTIYKVCTGSCGQALGLHDVVSTPWPQFFLTTQTTLASVQRLAQSSSLSACQVSVPVFFELELKLRLEQTIARARAWWNNTAVNIPPRYIIFPACWFENGYHPLENWIDFSF